MVHTETDYTLIIGAGALGAMYAQQIQAAGHSVAFLADGERAARLRGQAIRVNGTPLPVTVYSREDIPARGHYPARVIVALKDQHMQTALGGLDQICGPDTTLLSVMNGIDSEAQIAEALGEKPEAIDTGRVLHCMVAGMDAVREGTEVQFSVIGRVFFGRRTNRADTTDAHVGRTKQFFDAVGIPYVIPEDMEHAIWNKFMLNVGINQWSAVLGATYSVFHAEESARMLMRRAMNEVLAVAVARGVSLTQEDLEHWYEIVNTLGPAGKTSMLQDVEAHRKTEVEMFAGRVVEMGREVGVPTPVNEVLLDAIHTIESMYAAER